MADDASPALVVVHGIGRQLPGATLRQAAAGLLAVCPGATLHAVDGDSITEADIDGRALQRVLIRQGTRTLRLFEVYWADLLPDALVSGTFTQFHLDETTWFPYLNWRAGLLPRSAYPAWLVYARTAQLWFLQLTMTQALEVLTSCSTIRERDLDRTAADVWHYIHALGGDPSTPVELRGAAEAMLDRAEAVCVEAAAGGPLHLVGHSLGSVVAYHVMTRRLPTDSVAQLVTLGSPLEKVRFIWAALFPPTTRRPRQWSNYFTPSDPVSGALKRFTIDPEHPIRNIRRWGLGGYGEAHVGYFRDVRIACDLATGMGATVDVRARGAHPAWWWRRLLDVGVPLVTAAVVMLGVVATAAVFGAAIWLTGWVMGAMASLWSSEALAATRRYWRQFWGPAAAALWVVFTTKDGYSRSSDRHASYWRTHREP